MSLANLWQTLEVGDLIRLTHIPTEFTDSDSFLHQETLLIYQHLVQSQQILEVQSIDADGYPWVEYVWKKIDQPEEHHSLMLNHDGLELQS